MLRLLQRGWRLDIPPHGKVIVIQIIRGMWDYCISVVIVLAPALAIPCGAAALECESLLSLFAATSTRVSAQHKPRPPPHRSTTSICQELN